MAPAPKKMNRASEATTTGMNTTKSKLVPKNPKTPKPTSKSIKASTKTAKATKKDPITTKPSKVTTKSKKATTKPTTTITTPGTCPVVTLTCPPEDPCLRIPEGFCIKMLKSLQTTKSLKHSYMSMLLILLSIAEIYGREEMPWDKWSWSMPQQPIEFFFRRHDLMPIKSPSFQCECPPNKECTIDFKVNEDMPEFLNMRGVMKDDELQNSIKDIQSIKEQQEKEAKKLIEKHRAKRRSAGGSLSVPEEGCCCPPRNVMVPTFITDNKFDNTVKRISQMKKEFNE